MSPLVNRNSALICLAAAVTLPGLFLRLSGMEASPPMLALAAGAGVLGASFLLLFACDAAQTEISQALSLAVVALIAVLPEYSVDMYFTWQAGKQPDSGYAHYAIANMTGANRLLIGVAWSLIALISWARFRKPVKLERDRSTELLFLAGATLYAFFIPLKGSLDWYDGVVFLSIYAAYIIVAGRRKCAECEVEGPAELLVRLPQRQRRLATLGMFAFAAVVILANAEPFCEGLIGTGKAFGVSEFLLVQWLAPIASEAPEFIVALMFAWRGQAGLGLGSLLSAKLNQWTLLVGMIPGVFALSSGSLDHPLPMSGFQMSEILLTAAQSLLGVLLLAGLSLSVRGCLLLFGLFLGQLVLPGSHSWFAVLYLAASVALFARRPSQVPRLLRMSRQPVFVCHAINPGDCRRMPHRFQSPECARCPVRLSLATQQVMP